MFATYNVTKAMYDVVGATAHFGSGIIFYTGYPTGFVGQLAVLAMCLSAWRLLVFNDICLLIISNPDFRQSCSN